MLKFHSTKRTFESTVIKSSLIIITEGVHFKKENKSNKKKFDTVYLHLKTLNELMNI